MLIAIPVTPVNNLHPLVPVKYSLALPFQNIPADPHKLHLLSKIHTKATETLGK